MCTFSNFLIASITGSRINFTTVLLQTTSAKKIVAVDLISYPKCSRDNLMVKLTRLVFRVHNIREMFAKINHHN